jgi:hypothetical protein
MILLESGETLTAALVQEIAKKHAQTSLVCWKGTELPLPFQWLLILDPHQLWFSSTMPFPADDEAQLTSVAFLEGLWEKDVVELFLMDSQTGRYLEFNFCPINAWWASEFESYRCPCRSSSVSPQLNSVAFRSNESSWSVTAALALDSLPFSVLDSSTLAHISGIAQRPPPPQCEPVFLTSNTNRSETYAPDFHRLASFLPLRRAPLSL